ncbi:MAG: peptidase M13 [Actinomycetaceae bacterium]|nr:peptidase M13 [Actinomycetaceae bacterium]
MISDATTTEVVKALSPSIRPADDFFRYVNDEWLQAAKIPADQASTGSFINLRNQSEIDVRTIVEELVANGATAAGTANSAEEQKIADLYSSFMDVERINQLGASPLAAEFAALDVAETKEELALVLGRFLATGIDGPFNFSINADRNNPDRYVPWFYQSGLGLPDEAYYRAEEHAPVREAYTQFIPMLYALTTGADTAQATAAAETIMAVETALAAHHFTNVEARNADLTNNLMSFTELCQLTPGFDMESVLDSIDLSAANAPEILVMTPRSFTGFADVWAEFDVDAWRTYLRWHLILARAAFLSEEISLAHFSFYGQVLAGQEQQRDRWKRAVGVVNSALGEAVGKIYVARHFPPAHKAKMEQLVADLIAAYRESISTLDWMTAETKAKALVKLESFTTKIGYPVKWKDYSALSITPDSLVDNIRAIAQFDYDFELAKLSQPVDRDEWHMLPQTVNAYYSPVGNEIVFPAAILQPPFFDADADPAWNYGGIGAVIGHEIGHGFDDQGSKYDGEGRINNWWTDTDRAEFEKRTKSLVAQYDAYIPAQLGPDSPHHVNGELTLGENIGDLGGLTIGLKAYNIACQRDGLASSKDAPVLEGFSGIQRVLLSYARIWQEKRRDEFMIQLLAIDPHSPAEFRCNGIVKNLDEFAEAFDVQEGDALYLPPDERVRIW